MERKQQNPCDDTEFEHENLWTCCSGGKIDKRGMIFIVQTSIVLMVLLFSMFMIAFGQETQDATVWVSILSAIVGNFLPTQNGLNSQNKEKI